MYFFHYTKKNAHDTMTGSNPWRCEARQPQKDTWYSEQHEFGFYVTPLSPLMMGENNKARKTGGGGTWPPAATRTRTSSGTVPNIAGNPAQVDSATASAASEFVRSTSGKPSGWNSRAMGSGTSCSSGSGICPRVAPPFVQIR